MGQARKVLGLRIRNKESFFFYSRCSSRLPTLYRKKGKRKRMQKTGYSDPPTFPLATAPAYLEQAYFHFQKKLKKKKSKVPSETNKTKQQKDE